MRNAALVNIAHFEKFRREARCAMHYPTGFEHLPLNQRRFPKWELAKFTRGQVGAEAEAQKKGRTCESSPETCTSEYE